MCVAQCCLIVATGMKHVLWIFYIFWCTYRASCTGYCDVCTMHLVQFIVMYVPCILYSLLWCTYRASCTGYCDVCTVHLVQFIVMYIPCILCSLLSRPMNVQHIQRVPKKSIHIIKKEKTVLKSNTEFILITKDEYKSPSHVWLLQL
jgi:hypothetical protein